MAVRKWELSPLDRDAAAKLAEDCELRPFLALLLTTRHITTAQDAMSFLLGDDPDDPYDFADMDAAVERIEQAIQTGETIMIYGDYDVDGITATVLLYTYLLQRGARVTYRLPTRSEDGYGLHRAQIDEFADAGISLLITVDNGISAVNEVAYAAERGMAVVITDHHQPSMTLPAAVAVVDPHRADCPSGCVNYAGVGVAFMLVCALDGDPDAMMEQYGDLLALGMLADVMPLIGTTRTLVRRGLAVMNHLRRPGLRALVQQLGLQDKEITAQRVVFSLVPQLNAAGRMDDPQIAARLLLEQNPEQAAVLAETVQSLNTARQTTEHMILTEMDAAIWADPQITADRVIVIAGEDWHPGVMGILAARLTERYGKPAIVLSIGDGIAAGSGRSIAGFSLFDALTACATHLQSFGGHELAAGLTISPEAIPAFREAINAYAAKTHPRMPVPVLHLDCKLRPAGIDAETLAQIAALEPFGAGNPVPVFGLFGMRLDNIVPLSGGKHLRLSFSKEETHLNVLAFGVSYATVSLTCGDVFDLAVSLEKNVYKGVVTPQIVLRDLRYAATDETLLLEAYRKFDAVMRRERESADREMLPQREHMAKLYRHLVHAGGFRGTLEQLYYAFGETACSFLSIRILLEIWREAGLVTVEETGERLHIIMLPVQGKADLTQTALWQFLQGDES